MISTKSGKKTRIMSNDLEADEMFSENLQKLQKRIEENGRKYLSTKIFKIVS